MRRPEWHYHEPRKYRMPAEGPETDLSLAPAEGAWQCQPLDLGLVPSRTMRQGICVVSATPFVVLCPGSISELVYYISSFTSISSLVPSPWVQAGLSELLSCLPSLMADCSSRHQAILSGLVYGVKVIPSALPVRVLTCPAPNTLVLTKFSNYYFLCHSGFCKFSLVGDVRRLELDDWSQRTLLSGSFILPYIVYSQILEDCTFCLIMLETDWHFSCYSL